MDFARELYMYPLSNRNWQHRVTDTGLTLYPHRVIHISAYLPTTDVVSPNPVHGKEYSIQHYVIKFVNDLRQAGCFYPGTPVSSTNKTKILLKVALDTINQPYSNGQKQTNTLNNIGTEINT